MRILIADDESIIRMGLTAMLQEMGHEVLAAHNGREALQMARRHKPDLAILDIKMPYTNGLQVARTLGRSQPMPLILLTAYSEQNLIETAADLPIQGYLLKPVRPEALSAAIAVATRRFTEMQALETDRLRLEQKLRARKLIDRAKGRLMQTGLSEEEAYRLLQQRARDNGQSLQETAQAILDQ